MTEQHRVPVGLVFLSGPTFLRLERHAEQHHTTVAVVVSHLVELSVAGKPRTRKKRTTPTPERIARVLELKAAGMKQVRIAHEVELSESVVSRIVTGQLR